MGTAKLRLIDSDIISNLLRTLPKSSIEFKMLEMNNLRIITTNLVVKEVELLLAKISNNEFRGQNLTEDVIKNTIELWKQFKSIIDIRPSVIDPSQLKNVGERSLVNLLKKGTRNSKIVSNNREDVLKALNDADFDRNYLETPFEFYEEVGKFWFSGRSDTIKFMIIANHDFRILNKEYCGSILRYVH